MRLYGGSRDCTHDSGGCRREIRPEKISEHPDSTCDFMSGTISCFSALRQRRPCEQQSTTHLDIASERQGSQSIVSSVIERVVEAGVDLPKDLPPFSHHSVSIGHAETDSC